MRWAGWDSPRTTEPTFGSYLRGRDMQVLRHIARAPPPPNNYHATASGYPPPRTPYRTISSNVTSRADGKLNANALHASV